MHHIWKVSNLFRSQQIYNLLNITVRTTLNTHEASYALFYKSMLAENPYLLTDEIKTTVKLAAEDRTETPLKLRSCINSYDVLEAENKFDECVCKYLQYTFLRMMERVANLYSYV